MANPAWYEGRTSRFFAVAESTYGTAAALVGTSAVRVLKAMLDFDPHKYRDSPQRYTDPSQRALLLSRYDAKFSIEGLLYPSGTLNTLPEQDVFLSNGLGVAATNRVLATTMTGGGETTTSATVVSAGALAIGDWIQITTGGNIYARRLTNVAGAVLTWSVPLVNPTTGSTVTPVNGDAVKGGISYGLGTALLASIDMAGYPHAPAAATPARELLGGVIDKIQISCDSNSEPKFVFSGPGAAFAGSAPNYTPQSEPGTWTVVGSESGIPTGMQMTVVVHDGATPVLYQVTKIDLSVDNGMAQQNIASGTNKPTAMYRNKKRAVRLKVASMVSDDKTLWTPSLSADASTTRIINVQIGTVSGFIWAFEIPIGVVEAPPAIPDSDETQQWDYMIRALASGNGNNELYTALL